MALCLDTEFNSFGGDLISLALVDEREGAEYFYEVLPLPAQVHPWVAEHVVPLLDKEPISPAEFDRRLHEFLQRHQGVTIVADWPEDFIHLSRRLVREGGWQLQWEGDMRLVDTPPLHPAVPHNALSDAIALALWWRSIA